MGTIPAFSKLFHNSVIAKHAPSGRQYINETLDGGISVILAWFEGHVDAVCFLSESDARAYPGFDERRKTTVRHFP